MSTIHISDNGPSEDYMARCDNCGTVWPDGKLKPIQDAQERLYPGLETPAGECPSEDCGALCYVYKE